MELAEIRYMGIFRKLLFRTTVEKNKEFLTPHTTRRNPNDRFGFNELLIYEINKLLREFCFPVIKGQTMKQDSKVVIFDLYQENK